jgi:hypothetical protein
MTRSERLSFIVFITLVLAIVVAAAAIAMYDTASAAPSDACDPAYIAQCCACPPSDMAEPAPLPHLYLPAVHRAPYMSAEFTPVQPVVTVVPER